MGSTENEFNSLPQRLIVTPHGTLDRFVLPNHQRLWRLNLVTIAAVPSLIWPSRTSSTTPRPPSEERSVDERGWVADKTPIARTAGSRVGEPTQSRQWTLVFSSTRLRRGEPDQSTTNSPSSWCSWVWLGSFGFCNSTVRSVLIGREDVSGQLPQAVADQGTGLAEQQVQGAKDTSS
jgi:hypothetical protein